MITVAVSFFISVNSDLFATESSAMEINVPQTIISNMGTSYANFLELLKQV